MSINIGHDIIGQVTCWRQYRKGTNLIYRKCPELLGTCEMTVKFTIVGFTKVANGLKRSSPILMKLTPVERPKTFELKHTSILERK